MHATSPALIYPLWAFRQPFEYAALIHDLCAMLFSSDMAGIDVMKAQDTPVATRREDSYVYYGANVELQKPLEKLPKGKSFFFFLYIYLLSHLYCSNLV